MTQPDVPKPTPLTDRATRVTALAIVGRVHTGLGTSPDRLAREAEVLIPWLASGKLPEPDVLIAIPNHMTAEMWDRLSSASFQPEPTMPDPGISDRPKRRRWWKR